ncbi:hypothetical protein [Rugamonas rubra]|uniref:hypothetical protein n=1 Tax=Rugamonas rubra TaxID=758825 RepID=UPI001113C1BF|nr:hypothetical protein [Rugamonas rubra]
MPRLIGDQARRDGVPRGRPAERALRRPPWKVVNHAQSRVERAYRGCGSMGEQKLPKPCRLAKRHYSCAFQTREYAITQKLHLNQQLSAISRYD